MSGNRIFRCLPAVFGLTAAFIFLHCGGGSSSSPEEATDAGSLFADPAHFDFHLRADALNATDTGSPLLAPAADLDGIARPRGGGFDLGCYER